MQQQQPQQQQQQHQGQPDQKKKPDPIGSSDGGDDRIDPMIDPEHSNPLDYPMAFFDPVTVSTHEKERRGRQTTNTLNDIYKNVTRFEDIFIEPPYEIDTRAAVRVFENDLTHEKVKILRSLYDWFAAAVFDVEACQLPLSEEDMAISNNAMSEANEYIQRQTIRLRSLNREFQDKCSIFKAFILNKPELADEMLTAMGVQKAVIRPPPPKIPSRTNLQQLGSRTNLQKPDGSPQDQPPVQLQPWRPLAKSLAEALKKAKAEDIPGFSDTEEMFSQLQLTMEKQEALIKDLLGKLKFKQDSVAELAESNERNLKKLKDKIGHIKSLPGDESVRDEVLKFIEVEIHRTVSMMNAAVKKTSTKSIKGESSKEAMNPRRSSGLMSRGSSVAATSVTEATLAGDTSSHHPMTDEKTGKSKKRQSRGPRESQSRSSRVLKKA